MRNKLSSICYLLLMVFVFACDREERMYDPMTVDIDKEIESFSALVDQNLKWRARGLSLLENIKTRKDNDLPISSEQIALIHEKGIGQYTQIREEFWKIIEKSKRIVDEDVKVKFTDKETSYDEKNDEYLVNPTDENGRKLIKLAKMSFSAGLILCDNYGILLSTVYKDGQLRRLTNLDDENTRNALDRVVKSFLSPENRLSLNNAHQLFVRVSTFEKQNQNNELIKNDKDNFYLDELILGSPFYNHRYGEHAISDSERIQEWLGERFDRRGKRVADKYVDGKNVAMNGISKVFGNTLGLIEKRKGKMLEYVDKNEEEGKTWVQKLSNEMRALDVIFEKTPFRTTDKFIPGHWGHVAIWSGNQQELERMGLWNKNAKDVDYNGEDYLDQAYQKAVDSRNYTGLPYKLAIATGHQIIEALRPGVQINTVHHFMNIDDFAVMRLKEQDYRLQVKFNNSKNDLEDEIGKAMNNVEYEKAIDMLVEQSKIEMLKNAFEQIGKDYDFNFNVETAKKIVCSELAYVTYADEKYFPWSTTETLKRATISPDEVAIEAKSDKENSLFEPVILFHAAVRFPDDRIQDTYDKLLDTKYDEIEFDFGIERKVDIKEYK